MRAHFLGSLLFVLLLIAGRCEAAGSSALRAGTAKIDITPAVETLRPGDRIRDRQYVRAIVLRNASACAVLVGVDQGMIPGTVIAAATVRVTGTINCPPTNIVISATHTHSGSTHGIEAGGEPNPQRVENAIVDAVVQAAGRMQAARIGFGTSDVYLNTNRDLFVDGQWMQGPNPKGASDKTLAVLAVLDSYDRPLGVYMNYAMHPINFYLSGVVSSDVPGEASRYVEERYGSKTVAIFAQGASGDQNPLFARPLYRLVASRTGSPSADDLRQSKPAPWVEMAQERNANARLTESLKSPVPADRMSAYENAIRDQSELVAAMGAILGETAINIINYGTPRFTSEAAIGGVSASLQCPGRDRLDQNNPVREGSLPPYSDGMPVTLKLGVLRLGDIHIVSIDGEIYSEIGARLKRESPASKLMITTLANGIANSGYIYSNEAGSHLTFQVISSRLKPGCAEDKIVNTAIELISREHD